MSVVKLLGPYVCEKRLEEQLGEELFLARFTCCWTQSTFWVLLSQGLPGILDKVSS